eukprot:CAMPEP_0113671916 /NCGR_PEP_ID=MMETSP0038_2-20120614/5962_1 /TAXON_ID=2898 /ORGANISM="Cryptomonas paramecium" /LENGTH=606 /DNA_ID=CAMNT_0000588105 /DNA_START=465 /DNA_END=2282 /DNA_ORIENTATION=- /assembly_acc=CAM_ASM_000170
MQYLTFQGLPNANLRTQQNLYGKQPIVQVTVTPICVYTTGCTCPPVSLEGPYCGAPTNAYAQVQSEVYLDEVNDPPKLANCPVFYMSGTGQDPRSWNYTDAGPECARLPLSFYNTKKYLTFPPPAETFPTPLATSAPSDYIALAAGASQVPPTATVAFDTLSANACPASEAAYVYTMADVPSSAKLNLAGVRVVDIDLDYGSISMDFTFRFPVGAATAVDSNELKPLTLQSTSSSFFRYCSASVFGDGCASVRSESVGNMPVFPDKGLLFEVMGSSTRAMDSTTSACPYSAACTNPDASSAAGTPCNCRSRVVSLDATGFYTAYMFFNLSDGRTGGSPVETGVLVARYGPTSVIAAPSWCSSQGSANASVLGVDAVLTADLGFLPYLDTDGSIQMGDLYTATPMTVAGCYFPDTGSFLVRATTGTADYVIPTYSALVRAKYGKVELPNAAAATPVDGGGMTVDGTLEDVNKALHWIRYVSPGNGFNTMTSRGDGSNGTYNESIVITVNDNGARGSEPFTGAYSALTPARYGSVAIGTDTIFDFRVVVVAVNQPPTITITPPTGSPANLLIGTESTPLLLAPYLDASDPDADEILGEGPRDQVQMDL